MKNKPNLFTILLITCVALSACQPANTSDNQDNNAYDFKINQKNVTVSGISSGGYMASQFHIAYSSKISGAALIASGPYWCARGSISRALGPCLKGGSIDPLLIQEYIEKSQQDNSIDKVANLANDKVWIFHGNKDVVVDKSLSHATQQLYSQYLDKSRIKFVNNIEANHGMPTLDKGVDCATIGGDFINSCNYDAAGELLNELYGPLKAKKPQVNPLLKIDQSKYKDASLTDFGYLYVPSTCHGGKSCRLHIAFHGCKQSSEFIDDSFIKQAGYNEWAESNDIIVFYPQIKSSSMSPMNPNGCWDWWGYTGEDYANKKGPQMTAINALINEISGTYK